MKIDILGAGIGGLTTAVAFEKNRIDYNIFESVPQIKFVGTGIILANNAMQVFKKMGLSKDLETLGNPISSLNITKPNLKPFSKTDLSFFEKKNNVKSVAIHRGLLQQVLLKNIDEKKLSLGKRLISLSKPKNFELTFSDDSKISSNALIGADGIHSVVRNYIFPKYRIRRVKQVCWRAVIDFELPKEFQSELNEAWGFNKRFGFVKIAENKLYWYALTTFNAHLHEFKTEGLRILFQDFHPLIRQIIEKTSVRQIHIDEISDLRPISTWIKGNACLLGDAAHAMTPNLGQGACQTIEDVHALSECIKKYPVEEAFKKYQTLRIAKARYVVNTSWQIGKMAHFGSPFLSGIVYLMIKNTPRFIQNNQSEKLFELASI